MSPWGDPGSCQELWGLRTGQQGNRIGGDLKVKSLLGLSSAWGKLYLCVRARSRSFAPGKISVPCPHWDAETRGAGTWDNAQALLGLFPSFPPALEFSTLFILN